MRHVALAACLMLPAAGAASANPEIVERARATYVSLERQGLGQFTCAVTLNWDAIVAVAFRAQVEIGKQVGVTLAGLPLIATVATDKPAQVTFAQAPPPGLAHGQLIDLVASGVNGMVSGVLTVWSSYVLTSPFPAPAAPFDLADQAGEWLLTYTDKSNKVELTLGKDYTIRRIQTGLLGASAVVQPQFTSTIRGLLLSSFQAEARSSPDEPPIPMQAKFAYQQVEDFDLPKTITLSSGQGGVQLEVVATFSECRVTKR